MVLNKNKRVKVANVSFASEMTFYYLDSLRELEELRDSKELLFESETDFFIVRAFNVFRVVKPQTMPRILECKSLELNPDAYAVKVELSRDKLFDFARREQLFIFECGDTYYLPSSIMMFAKKETSRGVKSE